jgi:hypothetical protein
LSFKKIGFTQMLMAHTCNPNYSEAEIRRIEGSRPAWAKSSQEQYSSEKTGHGGVHLLSQLLWEA